VFDETENGQKAIVSASVNGRSERCGLIPMRPEFIREITVDPHGLLRARQDASWERGRLARHAPNEWRP
jgi:hypothetical protein